MHAQMLCVCHKIINIKGPCIMENKNCKIIHGSFHLKGISHPLSMLNSKCDFTGSNYCQIGNVIYFSELCANYVFIRC